MSFRTDYVESRDGNKGFRNPCMCPFHDDFKPLKERFFRENKGYIWKDSCSSRSMVYKDRAGLKAHCVEKQSCWKHRILIQYLERLYPVKKQKKNKKKCHQNK